jgi:hypothetical protein
MNSGACICIILIATTVALQEAQSQQPQCTANWAGGSCTGNVFYNANTTLTNTVSVAGNVTINGGVTLSTDGFSILSGGVIDNFGALVSGYASGSSTVSYGGSGGGGGGGGSGNPNLAGSGGYTGNSTLAQGGGSGGGCYARSSCVGDDGHPGSTPNTTKLTSVGVESWYSLGIQGYLEGAPGGKGGCGAGGCGVEPAGTSGLGTFGLFLEAYKIINNGTMTTCAAQGGGGWNHAGGGGGGGAGSILLVSNAPAINGSICDSGGAEGNPGQNGGGLGGSGGNGQVLAYIWSAPPIATPLVISSIAVSNTTVGIGQVTTISLSVRGGIPSYVYNYTITNSSGAMQLSELSFSNALTWSPLLSAQGTDNALVRVYDSKNNVTSLSFQIVVKPTLPIITNSSSNTIINQSTTSTTTIAPSGGGGGTGWSGGGGGSSGGGSAFLPSVSEFGGCATISNFSTKNEETILLGNATFNVTDNFITPNSTGVTVNNALYTLLIDKKSSLQNRTYTIELLNLSYLPILKSVEIELCASLRPAPVQQPSPATTTSTSTTTTITTTIKSSVPQEITAQKPPNQTVPIAMVFLLATAAGFIIYRGKKGRPPQDSLEKVRYSRL